MDVPSCLQKDVRLSHGQRWAGALRFNPFAILRGMDRKQSHPSSINVPQRPLGRVKLRPVGQQKRLKFVGPQFKRTAGIGALRPVRENYLSMNSTSSPGLLQDSRSLCAGEALIAVAEPEILQMWPDGYSVMKFGPHRRGARIAGCGLSLTPGDAHSAIMAHVTDSGCDVGDTPGCAMPTGANTAPYQRIVLNP